MKCHLSIVPFVAVVALEVVASCGARPELFAPAGGGDGAFDASSGWSWSSKNNGEILLMGTTCQTVAGSPQGALVATVTCDAPDAATDAAEDVVSDAVSDASADASDADDR